MKKIRLLAVAALSVAAVSLGSLPGAQAAEGCSAVYNANATQAGRCTYKATASGAIVASGATWKVTVNHAGGGQRVFAGTTPAYYPSSASPIASGDTVVAEIFGPGSVIVGTATEGDNVVLPKP